MRALNSIWEFFRQVWHRYFGPLPKLLEFSVRMRAGRLHGVRYPLRGGRPFLLVHGTMENTRIWADLGRRLLDEGFDVWMVNLRGNGNGTHRSTVHKYRKGVYGFDSMVTEDIPAIIDYVFSKTSKKVWVGGHSLGGMALAKALSGVTRNARDGHLTLDPTQAEKLARKVSGFVNMGGPAHFKNLPDFYRWVARLAKPVTETSTGAIPSLSADRTPTLPDDTGILARARRHLMSRADKAAALLLPRGMLNPENLDFKKKEFTKFREKALSPFHSDLADDLARWAKTGRYLSVDGFDYEAAHGIQVPILVVAGDEDELAPSYDLFQEAKAVSAKTLVRTALLAETSHIDLVYGARAARYTGDAIVQFVQDPIAFGYPGRPLQFGRRGGTKKNSPTD